MPKKYVLMSGHASTGDREKIDRSVLVEAGNTDTLILAMSYDDPVRNREKTSNLANYLTSIGAAHTMSVDSSVPSEDIQDLMENAGVVFLPGGHTEVFLKNLYQKGLVNIIRDFPGVVAGVSAGAYILGQIYPKIREGKAEIIPMTRTVPFSVKAHYTPEFIKPLTGLSYANDIYALEDSSAIFYDPKTDERKYVGNIIKFRKGKFMQISE